MIEIQYGLPVVVLVRLRWIYIQSGMGGRSDIKNVNMSQGGSLGYISTLSSDINSQASLCGRGGGASEPDRGTRKRQIDGKEKS